MFDYFRTVVHNWLGLDTLKKQVIDLKSELVTNEGELKLNLQEIKKIAEDSMVWVKVCEAKLNKFKIVRIDEPTQNSIEEIPLKEKKPTIEHRKRKVNAKLRNTGL